MSSDLAGKKLLILGANPETIPLVQLAEEMGIKTLVTSNRPEDPAKKYAWKACNVDGLDVPGLIDLARREQVDGILVGVADILVPAYCQVCETLDLPCYATREIVEVFSRKDIFKAACERYGVLGVPEYKLDAALRREDLDRIQYPVMVKPVDSCSGMGMTVCFGEEEIPAAVEKALQASRAGRFIVERYMECEDMGLYYTFKDGVASASCIYDRYTTEEQPGLSRVCLGGTYPSKHIKEYYEGMHQNALKLFRAMGIRNGVLMLSAFYEDGKFYVYDTGFRLQGEAPHLLMKAVHGFDQREMLIRFALTGSEGELDLEKEDDPYFRGRWAATQWFLLREGEIARIEGLEKAAEDPRAVANIQRLHPGDRVLPEWVGTEKQVLTRLYLVCHTKEELAATLKEYAAAVHVYDTRGRDMVLTAFDADQALELA